MPKCIVCLQKRISDHCHQASGQTQGTTMVIVIVIVRVKAILPFTPIITNANGETRPIPATFIPIILTILLIIPLPPPITLLSVLITLMTPTCLSCLARGHPIPHNLPPSIVIHPTLLALLTSTIIALLTSVILTPKQKRQTTLSPQKRNRKALGCSLTWRICWTSMLWPTRPTRPTRPSRSLHQQVPLQYDLSTFMAHSITNLAMQVDESKKSDLNNKRRKQKARTTKYTLFKLLFNYD